MWGVFTVLARVREKKDIRDMPSLATCDWCGEEGQRGTSVVFGAVRSSFLSLRLIPALLPSFLMPLACSRP